MDVGVIGAGQMGRPMAVNLARAGHVVTAYDPRPEALQTLAPAGVRPAATPRAVAEACDVAVVMVLDAAQAEAALFGDEGLATGPVEGSTAILTSSLPPAFVVDAARRAADVGLAVVDAPVSGGVEGATAGTLTIMAAGPREVVAACAPVLSVLGGKVVHVGQEPGLGATLKALNQAMYFTGIAVAAEAVVAGARAGLDPDVVVDVISGGSGDSWALRNRVPLAWRQDYVSGGSLAIALKDLRTAAGIGQAQGTPMPITQATTTLVQTAMALCDPRGDDPLIVQAVERLAGIRLTPTPEPTEPG